MSSSSSSVIQLRADGISKAFADRAVFIDLSVSVSDRERLGIIGENGSGKTTLLRVLAGQVPPDAGTIRSYGPPGQDIRVGLLAQQPSFEPLATIHQVLEAAVAPLRQAEAQLSLAAEALADAPADSRALDHYSTALETAQRLEVWQTDAHIETTLQGLGLGQLSRDHVMAELSGGQRARMALACLLLSRPDILCLDEPTNHLDDSAMTYLAHVISSWPGPVVLVSHDRTFLDDTVVALLDLDPAPRPRRLHDPQDGHQLSGAIRFSGTYTDYIAAQQAARARWQAQYDREQAELRRLTAAVAQHQIVGHHDWKPRTEVRMAQKYYADRNAKVVARRVNDARARHQELAQRQVIKPPDPLRFQGVAAAGERAEESSAAELLRARQVHVVRRLAPVSFTIRPDTRLLITGENGIGKSTLLHVLAGREAPTGGVVEYGHAVSVGLLTQETSWSKRQAEHTAQQLYIEQVGAVRAAAVPLAHFGLLHPRDELRPVAHLSIGQQRRLALAIVLANPPDVLLLDEPTNHLSLRLVTELEASLPEYPGALVVASHDRWLIRRWTGSTLQLTNWPLST